jgi:hypothetical protein
MKRAALLVGAVAVIGIAVSAALLQQRARRELSWAQAASIRTIHTSCRVYAETYSTLGFPRRLDQLGSPPQGQQGSPEHSGLIDDVLASGRKSGHEFSYIAEPRDKGGRTVGYRLSVRPQTYGITGRRSYYADATGTIRFTDENRPASTSDKRLN